MLAEKARCASLHLGAPAELERFYCGDLVSMKTRRSVCDSCSCGDVVEGL